MFHFGMTGAILIRGAHTLSYRSSKSSFFEKLASEGSIKKALKKKDEEGKDEEEEQGEDSTEEKPSAESWPPRFWKLLWQFEDGTEMAFTDVRRLGRIRYIKDPENHPPISTLGFDPLASMIPLPEFQTLFGMESGGGGGSSTTASSPKNGGGGGGGGGRKNMAIKALLLDQTFIAGIGNYLADELLYHACIHPEKKVGNLTPLEIQKMHHYLRKLVLDADRCHDREEDFPKDWLFHYRWTNKKASKDFYGNHIDFITVGGRTSAFVSKFQKISGYASEKEFEALVNKKVGHSKQQGKEADDLEEEKEEEKKVKTKFKKAETEKEAVEEIDIENKRRKRRKTQW